MTVLRSRCPQRPVSWAMSTISRAPLCDMSSHLAVDVFKCESNDSARGYRESRNMSRSGRSRRKSSRTLRRLRARYRSHRFRRGALGPTPPPNRALTPISSRRSAPPCLQGTKAPASVKLRLELVAVACRHATCDNELGISRGDVFHARCLEDCLEAFLCGTLNERAGVDDDRVGASQGLARCDSPRLSPLRASSRSRLRFWRSRA